MQHSTSAFHVVQNACAIGVLWYSAPIQGLKMSWKQGYFFSHIRKALNSVPSDCQLCSSWQLGETKQQEGYKQILQEQTVQQEALIFLIKYRPIQN